ncbi:hypothetical protein DKM44_11855 [Deinococcus irradiatisoli]|uniref:Uncharacterized protein n=1 Tax=Deinococcus irradiatisoli TaxID=2202254 RepID=A0A2Z3JFT7_9DEIO|nr:hypothetical protein DKM44_11855 [Deinococcus irradiatisoli]
MKPPTPTNTQPTVISGVVTPWTQGQTGTIRPPLIPELSTTVDTTGNFNLPLPNVATMTSTYSGDLTDASVLKNSCTNGTVTATEGLKFAVIADLEVVGKNPTYYTYSSYENGKLSYKAWWFANKAGTITADADCAVSVVVGRLKANLTLKAGWNIVNYVQDASSSNFVYTLTTGTQTNAKMTWRPNPISSQSLQAHDRLANPWGLLR